MAGRRYRLYIDESGDHTYSQLIDFSRRHLCLCGCMIRSSYDQDTFTPELERIKDQHFAETCDGLPVVLERNEIINMRGPFRCLLDEEKRNAFDESLLSFLSRMEYQVISVVIDKAGHQATYRHRAWQPYHFCLAALLERYCGLLDRLGAVGDVMAESRGKTEDSKLKDAYRSVYNDGTNMRPDPNFFRQVLTTKELKLKDKQAGIAGLQLSDLLAHPTKQDVLLEQNIIRPEDIGPFSQRMLPVVSRKYNCQLYTGRIAGYGRVFLP